MTDSTQTYHVPVLLQESIGGLAIHEGGVYVDVTFGGGGHSREILRQLHGTGHLYSFDQDADAEANIGTEAEDNFTFVRSNFRYLKNWMRYYGVDHIDGLLADLGVSSHHFDDEERGFSFRFDAPLDMRMNKRDGLTAADLLRDYSEEQLADVLYLYGEFRQSRRMAAAIVKACCDSALQLGLPEARLPLAQAAILLATAPKSNSVVMGIDAAMSDVRHGKYGPPPRELQNVHADSTGFERDQGYKYPHNYPNHWVEQQYLPDALVGTKYYDPGENKNEQAAKQYWDRIKGGK